MENLLQINDVFSLKAKAERCDSKTKDRLKSRSQEENKFKDFSQALKQQTQTQDEDIGKNVNTLEKSDEKLPQETETVNRGIASDFLEDVREEDSYGEKKIHLEAILMEDVEDEVENSSKEINKTERGDKAEVEERLSEDQNEKKDFNEPLIVPLIVENRQILPKIEPEKISLEDAEKICENDELRIKDLEVVNEDFQKGQKGKINLGKDFIKIVNNSLKDSVIGNTSHVLQNPQDVFDKFVQVRNLEFSLNIGINSALNEDKTKVGIVSAKQINSFNIEELQKHRIPEHNVQQSSDVFFKENPEIKISSARIENLNIKQDENIITAKAVVQKYDESRQNYTDTASNVIAVIAEQMDELKRVRRNALNVKIDLENGESLNCQLVVSNENLNVRFPSITEAFKTQLLNHWDQLKRFAEMRNFNLSNPYFVNNLAQ